MERKHKAQVKVIRTCRDNSDRLQAREEKFVSRDEIGRINIVMEIDPSETYQQIEGFGGAFTEAGAVIMSKLSENKRSEIMNAYFNEESGLGYSLCRTHINSCDFSLRNYSYDDVDGDIELDHFNISHDKSTLIPFIKEAMKTRKSDIKILASPWSPPAWMKTNAEMNNGGMLIKEYYDTWALYFSKYIKAYEKEGIKIWGVTVQNEPDATQTWDSCIYTGKEEADFVKNYLGPRFEKDEIKDIKILVWDHNKDEILSRAKEILENKDASKYIWGLGFHWYSGDYFEELQKTHQMFPDKKLLFTEGCQEGGVKLGCWELGERYGHGMIGDLNNWTVGWIDWNMVLDRNGGPNHVGNFCDAPIIADTETNSIYYQSAYYYMGHFSKFVKMGAFRIGCTSSNDLLESVAFLNPDGEVVIVVMNRSDEEVLFEVTEGEAVSMF